VVWLCGGLTVGLAQQPNVSNETASKQPSKDDSNLLPPRAQPRDKDREERLSREIEARLPQVPPTILPAEANAVDLGCVLRLAGVQNPEILIARAGVAEALALRQLAIAMALPNLNAGVNYDAHTGPLQQSSGNILTVNRNALYLGAGAGATAAGTVPIPGIQYVANVSEGLFGFLAVRQTVRVREATNIAVRNKILLRVAEAYMELVRAQGRRVVGIRNRDEAHEIARLNAVYAATGQGKQSDADRTAAELARRIDAVVSAEGEMITASARLAALLNIPPSEQLNVVDAWVVPTPIIPDTAPLHELLVIAMNQRPELAARRAAIREALAFLRMQQFLPFSPTVLAGYSAGTFGGGSNLVATPGGFQGFAESRFGSFAPRDDIDVVLFWTAQNMGLGNLGKIRVRRVGQQIAELEFVRELNQVRNEVAAAFAQIHARFAQIGIARRGVEAGKNSYTEDLSRIRGGQGLPIELLDSFRLLADGRLAYLDAVTDYDKAQFALYVALGQPPPKDLAQAVPSDLVPPPPPGKPLPACVPPGGPDGQPCNACKAIP
jgi:outer membrane protein TolC